VTDTKKNEPHVFVEMDQMPFSPPLVPRGGPGQYTPPPVPAGKPQACGICRKPRTDRIHIAGEAEADAESPNWG